MFTNLYSLKEKYLFVVLRWIANCWTVNKKQVFISTSIYDLPYFPTNHQYSLCVAIVFKASTLFYVYLDMLQIVQVRDLFSLNKIDLNCFLSLFCTFIFSFTDCVNPTRILSSYTSYFSPSTMKPPKPSSFRTLKHTKPPITIKKKPWSQTILRQLQENRRLWSKQEWNLPCSSGGSWRGTSGSDHACPAPCLPWKSYGTRKGEYCTHYWKYSKTRIENNTKFGKVKKKR